MPLRNVFDGASPGVVWETVFPDLTVADFIHGALRSGQEWQPELERAVILFAALHRLDEASARDLHAILERYVVARILGRSVGFA